MSGGVTATTIIAGIGAAAAAGGAVYAGHSANKAAKEQKKVNAIAKSNSDKQLAMAEQELNKKDAKSPDISSIQAGNQMGENPTATMLTGAGGVDPKKLQLGKNTLLGM